MRPPGLPDLDGTSVSGVQEYTTADGRVHVKIVPGSILRVVTTLGQPGRTAAFSQVILMDLKGVTRGQLVLGGNIAAPAGFNEALVMEINIIGYFGALPAIIDSGALSSFAPSRRFRFDDVEDYTSIGVEVREVYDGVPTTDVVPDAFTIQATGLFWS